MSSFEYAKWDGSQHFRPLSADAAFDRLAEYLLEHGDAVLRHLDRAPEEDADVLRLLVKEGFLEKDDEGKYSIAAKGVKRIEQQALQELFTVTRKDTFGKHETAHKGAGQVVHEDSKPYTYGDPVANLNLHETLKNAVIRTSRDTSRSGGRKPPGTSGSINLHIQEEDFVVYETEHQTSCATVVLLDMSGSMARYGKFYEAKKVALAMQALVRGRYQEDSIQFIGFYTYASPLSERDLLRAAPKPVSLFDSRVFLRVSLDKPPAFVPEHFTNIQAGLRFARNQLSRQSAQNKQIICITDGEPTAHLEGRDLVLIYPPSEKTSRYTLEEAVRCASEGIRISTFALVEDYFYLGLVNFVEEMARVSKGVAAYCSAGELGGYVLDSFVNGRRSRRQVG